MSLWFPLALCALPNAGATFAAMPKLTHVLHECVETDAQWESASSCSKLVRSAHPAAGVWVAACARNRTELRSFFQQVARPSNRAFLTGVASHASPVPFPEYVSMAHAAAPGVLIRQYPDICHAIHAQFPIADWHPAWSATHGRNPIIPMPMLSATIVRLNGNGSSPNFGVGGYSEGLSDDLNKHVWSALAADPEATSVVDAVQQYARYYFGAEHEPAMTAALFGLEQNWAGDASTNPTVPQTLAALQQVERAVGAAELGSNWRLLAYLYRGYFDAVVQQRLQFEQSAVAAAHASLRLAPYPGNGGSQGAIAAATAALATPNTDRTAALWAARLDELAGMINTTVGAEVVQSQATDLNRGTLTAARLSDLAWLQAQLAAVDAMPRANEQARLNAIARLLGWEDAGPGVSALHPRMRASAARAVRRDCVWMCVVWMCVVCVCVCVCVWWWWWWWWGG